MRRFREAPPYGLAGCPWPPPSPRPQISSAVQHDRAEDDVGLPGADIVGRVALRADAVTEIHYRAIGGRSLTGDQHRANGRRDQVFAHCQQAFGQEPTRLGYARYLKESPPTSKARGRRIQRPCVAAADPPGRGATTMSSYQTAMSVRTSPGSAVSFSHSAGTTRGGHVEVHRERGPFFSAGRRGRRWRAFRWWSRRRCSSRAPSGRVAPFAISPAAEPIGSRRQHQQLARLVGRGDAVVGDSEPLSGPRWRIGDRGRPADRVAVEPIERRETLGSLEVTIEDEAGLPRRRGSSAANPGPRWRTSVRPRAAAGRPPVHR